MVLDFSAFQEEVLLSDLSPELKERVAGFAPELLIESKNPYAPKLSFLLKDQNAQLISLSNYEQKLPSILSLVLADQLLKGNLPTEFAIEELLDMIFLLTEQERNELKGQHSAFSDEQIDLAHARLKNADPEALLSELQELLDSCPRIEKQAGGFRFDASQLLGTQDWCVLACDDYFLQALAFATAPEPLYLDFSILPFQLCQLSCFLFLIQGKIPQIISHNEPASLLPAAPNSLAKQVDRYGWESVRMSLVAKMSYDEQELEKMFDYLKHLRNLFKVLYEDQAFEQPLLTRVGGKEMRLLSQRWEILDQKQESLGARENYAQLLPLIQAFTREAFTRYLVLNKQEKNAEVKSVSAQVFLAIMECLRPLIPEFVARVEQTLGSLKPQLLSKSEYQGTKDYKIHLLFDILKGVQAQRVQLQLKKHLPIQLAIQANSDILHLLQSYELSLKSLFKIEEMRYLTTNEAFPSDFQAFRILDITVGVKSYTLSPQQDEHLLREKQHKDKLQALEYVRSTLMALSLNPLTDPQKIADKETELENLKNEIQHLEIKIQKAKMEKKS